MEDDGLTAADRIASSRPAGALSRTARLWSEPEVRWAVAATGLFAAGVLAQVAGAPSALWVGLFAACYAAGGWEAAREGVAALTRRRLDVDLLMVAAAVAAASIGQWRDGALLIVIFATSGALEVLATRRTQDSVRALLELAPPHAQRVEADGSERRIDAAALVPGDRVVVRPGERVPPTARSSPARLTWTRRRSPASRSRSPGAPATPCSSAR